MTAKKETPAERILRQDTERGGKLTLGQVQRWLNRAKKQQRKRNN